MLTKILNYIPLFTGNNGISKAASEKFMYDLYNKREHVSDLAAVFRVYNAEHSIITSFTSVVPFVNEVIIVDNASDDKTHEQILIIEEYCSMYNIKFTRKLYSTRIINFGPGYSKRVGENPEGSIAKYYNFAFADCESKYMLKADAGLIFFPSAMINISRMLRKNRPIVRFRGIEISGKTMAYEPRIFSQDTYRGFRDGEEYEILNLSNNFIKYDLRNFYFPPAYLHYRRILSHLNSLG